MATNRWVGAIAVAAIFVCHGQAQVLWNNGGFATGSVSRGNGIGGAGLPAPAGTQWSELADGNNIPGAANDPLNGQPHFRNADDFVLSTAATLTDVRVYGYTNGAPAAEGFTGGELKIWRGRPGDVGSAIVFEDLAHNHITGSVFTKIYRSSATTNTYGGTAFAPNLTRPIQEVTFSIGATLPADTYWIDYTLAPVEAFGNAFSPFVTFADGVTRGAPGANARQTQDGGSTWIDVVDSGSPASLPDVPQDFPFIVDGVAVPEPGSMALTSLAGVAALARAVRQRRKQL
jgi:hypothetical protein